MSSQILAILLLAGLASALLPLLFPRFFGDGHPPEN